jgi:general secretion pathway protein A
LYIKYFHFTEQPFSIAPDPHFIFMSARHQEGLAHLLYGINSGGGFVALTGEVGTGKTTLCHCLLQQLPNDIDLALILNPKLNATELLAAICDELDVRYDKNLPTLKHLTDALNQHLLDVHASGRRTVLLIDEAQNLSFEVLEQIRLLTNLETSKTKLLQIILVGQPELQKMLKREDLRQLNQRITARYHLMPLSFEETRAYIRHRLTVCEGNPDLFKPGAIRKIFKFSSGIPRIINILCDRALLGAYSCNAREVTPRIVKHSAKELLSGSGSGVPRITTLISLLLGACVVAAIFMVGFYPKALINKNSLKVSNTITPVVNPEPILKNPEPVLKAQENGQERFHELIKEIEQKTQSPIESLPTKPVSDFGSWLNDSGLTLNAALTNSLKLWGKIPPAPHPTDCSDVETLGLNCLTGKADWEKVLLINRPIILEFVLPDQQKRYALITGFRRNQNRVQVGDEMEFSLADIIKYWNGSYLIVWKPPLPDVKEIYPDHSSDHVLWLRQQLNVVNGTQETTENPQFFDKNLKKQVMDFQHQYHLFEDGIAGVRTILYLDNMTSSGESPHLKISE